MEDFFLIMSSISVVMLVIEILLFLILTGIGILILKKLPKTHNKFFNLTEYLPEDEIHTLRQVYYLIMMAACFSSAILVFIVQGRSQVHFLVLDIVLSLYIAITMEKDTLFRKFAVLLLIPYGSLTAFLFNDALIGFLDFIHIPVMIYFISYYYDKFKEYTEANSLGITIILLFTIVFISFICTMISESKNPLDALVMVSNAFTSNGYSVLGTTAIGKLNSIVLVWAGFIISSVGTATLTAAILTRHFNKKFEYLEELVKKNNDD